MSLNDVFTSAQTIMFCDSLSKFVVSKHLWWEFLHGEPCFCLDISVYTLKCVFCRHILLRNGLNDVSQCAKKQRKAVSPMSGSPTFDTGKK